MEVKAFRDGGERARLGPFGCAQGKRRPLQRRGSRTRRGHDLSCPYMDGARGKLEDRGGGRGEGGLKPPLRMQIGDLLGGDLLGLELAV